MYEIRIGNIGNFNGHSAQNLSATQVGQDCRVNPVVRGGTTHVRTCPGQVVTSFIFDDLQVKKLMIYFDFSKERTCHFAYLKLEDDHVKLCI